MANRPSENNLSVIMQQTLEAAKQFASANSVMGDPYIQDGVTVIPVSKVSVGFAGGGSDVIKGKKTNEPAGAGASVKLTPMSMLVIDEDGARLISVGQEAGSAGVSGIVSTVKGLLASKKKKNEEKED